MKWKCLFIFLGTTIFWGFKKDTNDKIVDIYFERKLVCTSCVIAGWNFLNNEK